MKLPSGTTARATEEWSSDNPDAAIPERVKARIFARYGGKCALTGKRLMPGEIDYDHIIALRDGGEHRESNLRPVWRKKHREKTAQENSERAKVNRLNRKHFQPRPKGKIPSRPFNQPRFDRTKFIERDYDT